MKMVWLLVSFVTLSSAMAGAQGHPVPKEVGGCEVVDSVNGPYRCPNQGCGATYYTFTTEDCFDSDGFCEMLIPVSICCGAFGNYTRTLA